jgi:hypothetical protein
MMSRSCVTPGARTDTLRNLPKIRSHSFKWKPYVLRVVDLPVTARIVRYLLIIFQHTAGNTTLLA